jgi:hypothetical protein
VTFAGATSEGGCTFATAYEQLRTGVLKGANASCHFGLVILLREGVAAWMELGLARSSAVKYTTATPPPMVAPSIADAVHADMVAVLASMVMAIPGEVLT